MGRSHQTALPVPLPRAQVPTCQLPAANTFFRGRLDYWLSEALGQRDCVFSSSCIGMRLPETEAFNALLDLRAYNNNVAVITGALQVRDSRCKMLYGRL
jgi:hypothetical protein